MGKFPPKEFLSEAQLEKLLVYVREKANLARQKGTTRPIVDELIILILVHTGLRASELCNLNIGDLLPSHGGTAILVRGARGNVDRSIEMRSEMANCIARFVRLYREGAKPDEPLLISERGKRIKYMSLYSKVRRIGKKAGIGKLYPGILRRTYLIRLYDAEKDLRFVQRQAGHASRKTTTIYVRMSSESEQKAKTMKTADSTAGKSAEDFNRQAITTESTLQEVVSVGISNSLRGLQQLEICEACGKSISAENGTRIDSGQVLCPKCLKELRGSHGPTVDEDHSTYRV